MNLISQQEAQRYVRRDHSVTVHAVDVCHLDLLEAMQVMLAALILGTAAMIACLQITTSR